MVGRNYGISDFTSAYCCIPFQLPTAYIDHPKYLSLSKIITWASLPTFIRTEWPDVWRGWELSYNIRHKSLKPAATCQTSLTFRQKHHRLKYCTQRGNLCLYLHFTNILTLYIPKQQNNLLAVLTLYLWYTNITYCFYSKTNEMHQFLKSILFCSSTLHVSDGFWQSVLTAC
jgi:hypothetical protein